MQTITSTLAPPHFPFLSTAVKELIDTTIKLYNRELDSAVTLSDYSFLVFPMAKAYEGFLKDFLFRQHLINQSTYESHRFRIGRALNPDLRTYYRDEQWLYDDISQICGPQLARQIWEVWLQCRNRVFHYFPTTNQNLTLTQAGEDLNLLLDTMKQMNLSNK